MMMGDLNCSKTWEVLVIHFGQCMDPCKCVSYDYNAYITCVYVMARFYNYVVVSDAFHPMLTLVSGQMMLYSKRHITKELLFKHYHFANIGWTKYVHTW